ncbi:hypothetical protein BLA29_013148, partial [Euroglyphus maynei]
ILRHTVTKPVLQEVREVIAPFRRITQTVQPVQESIETLVARNAGGAPAGNAVATLAAGPALATTGALGGGALLAGGPAFATAGALGGGALLAGGPAFATGATLLGTGLAGAGFGRAAYGYGAGAYGLAGLGAGKLYSKY